ncbi:MAG TPA: isocitrate lyase/phosphoenolpyruvate mutase family protein [Sporichthyaceae bacterium]|nr:isocitrate lyase/phosphoenolpyruvate mutase family protein [Sporichthyaceae bacterium]
MSTFRALHDGPEVLRLANVWDAGSARLVESLGAAAVATTSGGLAWSLGYADAGAMPAEVALGEREPARLPSRCSVRRTAPWISPSARSMNLLTTCSGP